MPIGPFPDFAACVAHMTKPKEEGGGGYDEETAKKVCGKMKAELEEGFSWAGSIKPVQGVQNLIRGKALHPIRTVHPNEWPQIREYLEEELQKSAHTLSGKPLLLDHMIPLRGEVLEAAYEDGAIEYIAKLDDQDTLGKIRDGKIKHCSVELDWDILQNVDGVAPRGITFTALSLLENMTPGDPSSSVKVWEAIIAKLKEAKGLAPPNPEKGSETEDKNLSEQTTQPAVEDRVKNLEQALDNVYSRITQVESTLTAKIDTLLTLVPHVEGKAAEAEWDTQYINDLPDSAFAVISKGGEKDEQGKTVPRTLRHLPHHKADDSLDIPHLRNALARLPQTDLSAEDKAEAKRHLCAHAKESEIVSEVCGEEKTQEGKRTCPAKPTLPEALISSTGPQQSDLIPKKAIEAVLPPDWIARAWGPGPQRFVQDIKRVLRQSREA